MSYLPEPSNNIMDCRLVPNRKFVRQLARFQPSTLVYWIYSVGHEIRAKLVQTPSAVSLNTMSVLSLVILGSSLLPQSWRRFDRNHTGDEWPYAVVQH